jgi:DHA3 family macrolide efflux protein-like MFS transporter
MIHTDAPFAGSEHPGAGWHWRFALIFGGQSLSLIGSALTQFVLLWWITDRTGSVAALAGAGLAALLPRALFGPLGGVFADRYSRRLLMTVADAICAACMAVLIALFLSARIELWHAYVLMMIRSAMQAFQFPAAVASTARLLPVSFLPHAAGFNQAMLSLTQIVAAPLGAQAISRLSIGWALSIDVLTALLGIAPLLVLDIPQARPRGGTPVTLARELRAGLALVWLTPGLRALYGVLGVTALVIVPSFTLLPLLVKQHFGGGAAELARMEGLSGAGMLIGALAVATLAPRRQTLWILVGLAASCLALALTALTPAGLFDTAVIWWVISGVAYSLGNAPLTTLLQRVVPNTLQGRAFSLLSTVEHLAAPVGIAFAAPLGELIGVRWLFVVVGTGAALICLAGFLSRSLIELDAAVCWPRVRHWRLVL